MGVAEENIRSLTVEDLEDENISDAKSQKINYGDTVKYGEVATYTAGSYFIAKYDGTENVNCETFEEASKENPISVIRTHYYCEPNYSSLPDYASTYGDILGQVESWLASTCVGAASSWAASYGVRYASGLKIGGQYLTDSREGSVGSYTFGVRPLISINTTTVKLSESDSGSGTYSSPWNLEKN